MSIENIASEKPITLDGLLSACARRINDRFGDIVNDDCSIALAGFVDRPGYQVSVDENRIQAQEEVWSDAQANNPNRLAWFKDKGLDTPAKRLAYWQEQKAKSASEKMEKAIVALFNKMFGQDFIIVRTARYDDYFNHVDTLIIDIKNKKVVGALDEVRGEKDYQRNKDKANKFQTVNINGAKIKYGLAVQEAAGNQILARQTLNNLPLFIISLNRQEVEELVVALSTAGQEEISAPEQKIFQQIIASLRQQVDALEKEKVSPPFRANIQSFKSLLNGLNKFNSLCEL